MAPQFEAGESPAVAKISAHFQEDIFRSIRSGELKGERRTCCCRRRPQRRGCLDLGELNVSEILVPEVALLWQTSFLIMRAIISDLLATSLVWSNVIQLQVLGAM